MINQQEEADSQVARQLAEQLRLDSEARRLAVIAQDESLGHHLQQAMHVGEARGVRNELPVPPKNFPQKLSPSHNLLQHHSPTNSMDENTHAPPYKPHHRPSPLNYVSLDLPPAISSSRQPMPMNIPSRTQYSQIMPQQPIIMNSPVKSHYDHLELQSHTPEKPRHAHERDLNLNHTGSGGGKSLAYPQSPVELSTTDEIRTIGEQDQFPFNVNQSSLLQRHCGSIEHNLDEAAGRSSNDFVQKLSLEKYDMIMGNISPTRKCTSPSSGGAAYKESNGNVYNGVSHDSGRDLDRIQTMQECGVPPDEILEINRIISQQERDEVCSLTSLILITYYTFLFFVSGTRP